MTHISQAEVEERRKKAAIRAAAEAEARRDTTPKAAEKLPTEVGNRKGPEPTRYGDWEKKGIVSDF